MNVTINITVNDGATLNINNYPQPTYQVIDREGLVHSFSKKEDYEAFKDELQEQR